MMQQYQKITLTQQSRHDTDEIMIIGLEKSGDLDTLFPDCKIEIMANCHFLREAVRIGEIGVKVESAA